MILTNKQEQGLNEALTRYRNGDKYVCIAGYAGSGKSTLVKFIIDALNVPDEQIVFATYTGKAAQVLVKKGNKNAMTLHKLLYQSYPRPNGTFVRVPKPDLFPYKIVVVDEISMVPLEMLKLLAKHKVFLICLGDPFQLPPIDKSTDNHLLDTPHVFLDEIMRQAQESEIIRLSMDIRAGKDISLFKGTEAQVLQKKDMCDGMLTWADQVICSTNATRIALNNQMRDMLGRQGGPQDGDKVICLRNYWETLGEDKDALVNGTIGYIQNSYSTFIQLPYYLGGKKFDVLHTDFISDSNEKYRELELDTHMILTGEKCCDTRTAYRLNSNPRYAGLLPLEFTYGYAITCHKAQGSEWDKVLVIEEGFPFSKEEHARWLYTAATRAAEKLVLIKK